MWHVVVTKDWKISFRYNSYHKNLSHGLFEIYKFFNLK